MSVYLNDRIDYLKEAIDSILHQDYKDCDVFVYCDGPINTDVEKYLLSLQASRQLQLFRCDQNKGLAYSLNYLIDKVVETGHYSFVARMDSDDISLSGRISAQVEFFNNNSSVDICGTFCEEFGSELALKCKRVPINNDELLKYSINHCPFIHPTVMFRCSVFLTGLRYPVDNVLTEDLAFWYLLIRNGYQLSNIPEIHLKYRINDETLIRRKSISKIFSEIRIRFQNMFYLRAFSIRNVLLLLCRAVLTAMPVAVLKFAYKKFR